MSRVFVAEIVVVCLLGHAEALLAQPISGGATFNRFLVEARRSPPRVRRACRISILG